MVDVNKFCVINFEYKSISFGLFSKGEVVHTRHHVINNTGYNLFKGYGISRILQETEDIASMLHSAKVICVLPYECYLNNDLGKEIKKILINQFKCQQVIFLSSAEGVAHFLANQPTTDISKGQFLVFDLQHSFSEIYLIRFSNRKFRRTEVLNYIDKYFQDEEYPLLAGLIAELAKSGMKSDEGFIAWLKYMPEIGRQYQFWQDSGQQPDYDLRIDYLSGGKLPPVELSKLFEVLQKVIDQMFSFDHFFLPVGSCHLLLLGFGGQNPLFRDALRKILERYMGIESFLDPEEFAGAFKLEGADYCFRKEMDIYPSPEATLEIPIFLLGDCKERDSHYLKVEARNQPVRSSYLYTIPLEKVRSVQDISIQIEDSVIQSKINLADCLPNLDADLNESGRFYKLVRLSARVDGCANVLMTVSDTTGLSREAVLTNLWEK